MPVAAGDFFREFHRALTGHESPFLWQEELFLRFCANDIPETVSLPTGAGKTSVMTVWLLALGFQAKTSPEKLSISRRIAWVVNRRVVVDQASREAEALVSRLSAASGQLAALCRDLRALSPSAEADAPPVAVSTLRGELADNREWSTDPSRPAIVVGTVDMVGSRLLFSGYGDSRRRRSLHGGLLGQDTLIVNDESHLTPAFADLLVQVQAVTGGERPLRTMLLSATVRGSASDVFPGSLEGDLLNKTFRDRYRAIKRLHLVKSEHPEEEIRRQALDPDRRTIVFVRSPKEAQSIASGIEKARSGIRVPRITGLQRGRERDLLLNDPVVERYLCKTPPPGDDPCWLVATSAGEVGIDLSADRLITDLDTADHLLQRFGRLNRFGETEGDAWVVYSPAQVSGDKGDAPRLRATLKYLESLQSASPEALQTEPPPPEAWSREPLRAPVLPWHIDVWSMTSLSQQDWPSRPAVEHWLHGDDGTNAPPETYLAWREDIEDLAHPGIPESDLEDVFEWYPVLAHERLKQYTEDLWKALRKPEYLDRRAILLRADGSIRPGTLEELLADNRGLRFGTLLLPPGVGYLDEHGMVDWAKPTGRLSESELARFDVSATDSRTRVKAAPGEAEPSTGLRRRCSIEVPTEDEEQAGPRWVYFAGRPAAARARIAPVLLEEHQEQLARIATDLACRMGLGERAARVFEWAGRWHDAGKNRPIWQRAAGNGAGAPALAKSERLAGRRLGGYRHELGSVLDAESCVPAEFAGEERDLALHLIASHHGWARPHFPERAFDKEAYRRSANAALECARRFGRLQQRFGVWGLAYLEAVFRSADAIASAGAPELPPNA